VPVCPVPPDQLPINEYQELQESWFFRWSTFPLILYLRRLGSIWAGAWLLASPVASASFAPNEFPVRFGLMATLGASAVLGLVLIRLYLGWVYVRNRLVNPTVVYEETGWYDGGAWEKPSEELSKDQLIATYQVGPTLQRLQWSLLILVGVAVGDGLLWLWLSRGL
jgi:Conserved in the green lineage and diatoms 27